MKKLATLFVFALIAKLAISQNGTFTTTGASTDWHDPAAWSFSADPFNFADGDDVPDATDEVVIQHPIIVSADAESRDIFITPDGTNNASLTIESGFTLTVANDGGLGGGGGNGELLLTYANVNTSIIHLIIEGELDLEGDFNFNKSGASASMERDTLLVDATGVLTIGGDFNYSSTSAVGRTVTLNGSVTCDNFNFSNTDCPTVFSVNDDLTISTNFSYTTDGTSGSVAQHELSVGASGAVAITGNATFDIADAVGGDFTFDGTFSCVNSDWTNTDAPSSNVFNNTFTTTGDFIYETTGTSTTASRSSFTIGSSGTIDATDTIEIASTGTIGADFIINGDIECDGGISIYKDRNNANNTLDTWTIDNGGTINSIGSRVLIRQRATADMDFDIINGTVSNQGAGDQLQFALQTNRGGDLNLDLSTNGNISTTDGALILQTVGAGTLTINNDGNITAGNGNTLFIRSNGGNGGPLVYNQTANGTLLGSNDGNIIFQCSNETNSLVDINLLAGDITTTGAASNVFFRTNAGTSSNLGGIDLTITDATISAGNDIDFSNDSSATGVTVLINGAAELSADGSIDIFQQGTTPLSFTVTGAATFTTPNFLVDDESSGVIDINISNGTFDITNDFLVDQNANATSTNTIDITGTADLNITNNFQFRQNGGAGINDVLLSNATTDVGNAFQLNVFNGGTGQNLVDIQGTGTMNVTGNFAVAMNDGGDNELDISGSPTITVGATFNVNNNSTGDNNVWLGEDVTLNAAAVTINGVNASGENNATFSNQGSLTGNFTITNDKTGTGINVVQLGTASEQATFTIGNNLNLSLNEDATALQRNVLSIANADITINGNLNFNNSSSDDSNSDAHQLLIDETNFPGTTKSITLLGNFSPNLGNTNYVGGATDFVLNFNNNGTQNWGINADGTLTLNDVTVAATSTTQLTGALTDNDIQRTATVNGILSLNGNQPTISGTDQIHINNGATLLNTGATDAMLYDSDAIQFESAGLLEFNSSGGGNIEILNTANFIAPNIILTGTRTKRFMANIDGTNQVGHVDIQEGSADFDATVTEVSLTDALSTVSNQELIVSANTILDFRAPIATFTGTLTAEDDSEVQYTNTSATVFSAEYFQLTFDGGTDKVLTGSGVIVRDKLSKSGNCNIDLDDTYLTLFSNPAYDGFLGEVTGNGVFQYNGSGEFILDKAITVSTENVSFLGNSGRYFRDLTVPIQEASLQNFINAGIPIYKKGGTDGFSSWGSDKTSAQSYTQSQAEATSTASAGFNNASTSDDLITSAPHAGWKVLLGSQGATASHPFKDTGSVNLGDQSYSLTFNALDADNDASRSANNGWHLIGNPYPCTIDLNTLIDEDEFGNFIGAETASGVFGKVWVKAPYDISVGGNFAGGQDDPYAFYNAVTDIGNANAALIPSHQAFWIKTFVPQASANSGTFDFRIKESHKVDEQELLRKSDNKKSDKPTLYDIDFMSSSNTPLGTISFHEFIGASSEYDPAFDIEKLGSTEVVSNAKIDFFSTQPMSLRVNAIGTKKHIQQFAFDVSANAGNYKLDLSGLQDYAAKYTCAFLHDLVTGEHINLKDTASSIYAFAVTAAETAGRFLVDYNTKNPSLDIYQPTCHDDNDGGVTLDAGGLIGSASFSIYKGLDKVASYSGEETFKTTLLPGEYTLVDNSGNLACAADKRITFTIENPPALAASFETEQSVEQGKETTLINTSENAETYEWYFADDMSYSSDENPTHTFAEQGKTMVSLTAYRNDGKCETHLNQYVYVNELTGLEGIQADEDIHITTSGNNQLSIETFAEGTYSIFTTDGKQVKAGKFSKGKTTLQLNVAGTYLVSVATLGETITKKLVIR